MTRVHESSIHELFRSTNRLLLGGFTLLIFVVLIIGLVSNSGRLYAKGAGDSTNTQLQQNARNDCVTDLRSQESAAQGDVLDAILDLKAVAVGVDPETGDPVSSPAVQRTLTLRHLRAGLRAEERRRVASSKLRQPELDRRCGKAVIDRTQIGN